MKQFFLLCLLLIFNNGEGSILSRFYKDFGRNLGVSVGADVGEPLKLTPFIQNGSILQGQQAALVQNAQFQNITSYAGYFTVDETVDANLWFWYFPSAGSITEDPLVLWLNGGPGASSLNGLFDENGPFIVNADSSVSLREYSWHKNHSLIYFDNPVGVGFSYTDGGFPKNQTKIGDDMYTALTQFFQLFPDLQTNPFFISGESYAGKYLPAIGHAILKNNPKADLKLNLRGILIGDGWTDPVNQLKFGPYLYNIGLISAEVKAELDKGRDAGVELIHEGNWMGARYAWQYINRVIEAVTKVNVYNYIEEYNDPDVWPDFLNTEDIRRALHVGDITFGDKGAGIALELDVTKSVAPWVEELLENYRVLVYTGQVDIVCGYPMVVDYLQTLNFTGMGDYHNSSREIWYVDSDEEPAGYVKSGGNLVELLVRNAGHMVPRDQPRWAYDMLYKFTRNIHFV